MTDMVQEQGGAEAPAEAPAAPSAAESLLASKTEVETTEPQADKVEGNTELPADFEKMFNEKSDQNKELTQLLRNKGAMAPEEYELAEGISFEEGDEMLASFDEIAKKHNLSNEAFNDIIAMKMAADEAMVPNREAEIEKLGPKGGEILKGVGDFFSSKLSAEGFAAVENLATTAEGVMALDTLRRELAPTQPVASRENVASRTTVTEEMAGAQLAKANALHSEGKIDEAIVERKKASAMFRELYPEA